MSVGGPAGHHRTWRPGENKEIFFPPFGLGGAISTCTAAAMRRQAQTTWVLSFPVQSSWPVLLCCTPYSCPRPVRTVLRTRYGTVRSTGYGDSRDKNMSGEGGDAYLITPQTYCGTLLYRTVLHDTNTLSLLQDQIRQTEGCTVCSARRRRMRNPQKASFIAGAGNFGSEASVLSWPYRPALYCRLFPQRIQECCFRPRNAMPKADID